jgi:hypothetical protein
MILDQQRRAQTLAEQTIDQSPDAEISSYRRHQGSVQSPFRDCDYALAQDTTFDSRSQIEPQNGRRRDLSDLLLPVSAVDLEEDVTNFRNLERRIRTNRLRLKKKPNLPNSCSCRKRHQEKQLVRPPFVVSLNEVHFHESSCLFWIPGSYNASFSFGMILCYLILGLKLRIFMTLSIASGTFSINPSLSARRIVSRDSPAFALIDWVFVWSENPLLVNTSAELIELFQTRKASPHDRLEDGTTLLHVSFDLVHSSICKYTEDRKYFCKNLSIRSPKSIPQYEIDAYRSVANHLLRYMSYADASDTDDDGKYVTYIKSTDQD